MYKILTFFSGTNEKKVSVDKNGREVDPILAFAKTQHLYAEGPDFLLSDLIIYPLYSLIMHRFSKVIVINICDLLDLNFETTQLRIRDVFPVK